MIDISLPNQGLTSFEISWFENNVVICPVNSTVEMSKDIIEIVIGNLLSRRKISDRGLIFIAYFPYRSAMCDVYNVVLEGFIETKAIENTIYSIAKVSLGSLDHSIRIKAIKSTNAWKELLGKRVYLSSHGSINPIEGVLKNITPKGYLLEGIDLPINGTIRGKVE